MALKLNPQVGTQTAFTGTLNTNEIYGAIYNWIISQRVFDIKVKDPTLANELRVSGTLFGDKYVYYSTDIGEDYDWGADAEAPKLLEINRNKKQSVQEITLNIFRQCNITVDNYLSKRAWEGEGVFSQFTAVLIGTLRAIKKVYEDKLINTFIGTQRSSLTACNIDVNMSGYNTAATTVDNEAWNRLQAQRISKVIADIVLKAQDSTSEYNENGYIRSFNIDDYVFVWNAEVYNKILKIDLPTIWHNEGIKPKKNFLLLDKYFGDVIATAGVATGAERAMIQGNYTDGTNTVFLRFGDIIPVGYDYPANGAYLAATGTFICKIFPKQCIPFLSAGERSTSFPNARSHTINHYLTWGHNTLQRLKEYPFITISTQDDIRN